MLSLELGWDLEEEIGYTSALENPPTIHGLLKVATAV